MKIDNKLISLLIKAIRSQEEINNILKYSEYGDSFYTQILCNELYYLRKLNNNNFQKRELYEELIFNEDIRELDILTNSFNKIKAVEFNDVFINEIQNDNRYLFKFENMQLYNKRPILDYLINAALIFQDVYINYQLPQDKLIYAEAITNAFLYRKLNMRFNNFVAEAIFSNYAYFKSMITNHDEFITFYLQLMFVQNQKNLDRIHQTLKLIEKNRFVLATYGPAISKYLYFNCMFSISDFTKNVDISYNTAKKYLSTLVKDGILKSIKVGKHNAFIYEDLYKIWRQ